MAVGTDVIPTPRHNEIPESPERSAQPVRGHEPLPLLFATLDDLEEVKKAVKTLGEKMRDLEARIQALEG